ncbi:hypothetical protein [Sulfurimonas hydrogeniphila]|uniref:hypothetical protein n=1 Tax=Sulfurimonas hydrogeniphila TaxID=2509341 RepID=UPI00125EDA9B|nr:hypothetical protein [Sulfurimonas hydrogeniphila]
MNSTIFLIIILGILGAISIALTYTLLLKNPFKKESKENKNESAPLPQKSIKLFNASGEVLLEYRDCYVSHFSQTLYLLSHQYCGDAFLKIDKGSDMLLLIENYTQGESDAKNEVI